MAAKPADQPSTGDTSPPIDLSTLLSYHIAHEEGRDKTDWAGAGPRQGRQAELRREATLFLISEGSWQAFQVRGTRIEANATALVAGGIAGSAIGGFAGRKVAKNIASRIDASTHPFEASLPFLLMIRSLAKCRSLEGEGALSIMAFSPDPKADKIRGKIWVLSHPDCKYGISESSFDAV